MCKKKHQLINSVVKRLILHTDPRKPIKYKRETKKLKHVYLKLTGQVQDAILTTPDVNTTESRGRQFMKGAIEEGVFYSAADLDKFS